jgi:hypothetical protein
MNFSELRLRDVGYPRGKRRAEAAQSPGPTRCERDAY